MTYYLTVDVGTFKHHVFEFKNKTRAQNAHVTLSAVITHASSPYPGKTTVLLDDDDEVATFRTTDLRAVSLVKSAP